MLNLPAVLIVPIIITAMMSAAVSAALSVLAGVDETVSLYLVDALVEGEAGALLDMEEAMDLATPMLLDHCGDDAAKAAELAERLYAAVKEAVGGGGDASERAPTGEESTAPRLAAAVTMGDAEDDVEERAARERREREAAEQASRDATAAALAEKQRARSDAAERRSRQQEQRAVAAVEAGMSQLAAELRAQNHEAARLRAANGRIPLGAVVVPSFDLPNPGGGANLLEDASATLVPGRRYALVGRNGKGKSTLLRFFAAGRLGGLSPTASVHFVNQEVSLSAEQEQSKPGDVVVEADVERTLLLAEREARLVALGGDEDAAAVDPRCRELDERLEVIEAATAHKRADRLLANLGFDDAMRSRKMCEMSGGWRVRTMLACALFAQPDILLLDEPTNHLSIAAILWLSNELVSNSLWSDSVIIAVSHDKRFLDDVATDTLHVSGVARRLTQVRGNYSLWAGRRKQELLAFERRVAERKEKIDTLEEYAGHGFRYGGSSSQINMMQRKGREAEKLKREGEEEAAELAALQEDAEVPLALVAGGLLNEQAVVQFRSVGFRYRDDLPWLLRNVDLTLSSKSRVVLLGENGAGKTTLMKLVQRMLKASEGEVFVANGARVALVNQHHADQLDLTKTPLAWMASQFPGDGSNDHELELRSHLAKTGVPAELQTTLAAGLSGGQRSRVALAAVSYQKPHLLLMDEPSNNLDIESVTALASCVREFAGGVVVVSHDQSFIEGLSDAPEIYAVADASLTRVPDFAAYRAAALKRVRR